MFSLIEQLFQQEDILDGNIKGESYSTCELDRWVCKSGEELGMEAREERMCRRKKERQRAKSPHTRPDESAKGVCLAGWEERHDGKFLGRQGRSQIMLPWMQATLQLLSRVIAT